MTNPRNIELMAIPKPDLTKITWAHAVNSQKKLSEALHTTVEMLEADIVLGQLKNNGPIIPIMAHPPATTSDLSLSSFLQQIITYNANTQLANRKGIKLDFKSIEVFEGSQEIMDQLLHSQLYIQQLWLNADIVKGPIGATTLPVDAARFINGCTRYRQAVLSLGWTTRWSNKFQSGHYESSHIDAMLRAIRMNALNMSKQAITFPVRAGIAARSYKQLLHLLEALQPTHECTLTIWSAPDDFVDVDELRELINKIGKYRIYLDLPEELYEQLFKTKQLEDSKKCRKGIFGWLQPTLVQFAMLSICIVAFSIFMRKN